MKRVRYDRQATADLEAISDYLLLQDPEVAIRFALAAIETVDWLASMPVTAPRFEIDGVPVVWRKFAVRGFSAYLIVHVTRKDELEVVRILDGRRDLDDLLQTPVE